MAKTTTTIPRGTPPDVLVERTEWNVSLAQFTRDNRGAHARLEVLGPGLEHNVETEDRPFDGIAADIKDGEDNVWITFGDTPENHFTHGIDNVTAIRVRPRVGLFGAAVLIESRDSGKTLLELSLPEEFALPPASGERRR